MEIGFTSINASFVRNLSSISSADRVVSMIKFISDSAYLLKKSFSQNFERNKDNSSAVVNQKTLSYQTSSAMLMKTYHGNYEVIKMGSKNCLRLRFSF